MSIRIYFDEELTQPVSDGDMASPDTETMDGGEGESRDRKLFLANDQTLLSSAMGTSDTAISLISKAFRNGEVLMIVSEKVLVTSGGGTASLTVQRAQDGTTAAAHAAGTKVYSAYNYDSVVVQAADTGGTDESSWLTFALTQGTLETAAPGAALTFGPKPYGTVLSFWRRITVPPETPVQNKTDLKIRVTAIESQA